MADAQVMDPETSVDNPQADPQQSTDNPEPQATPSDAPDTSSTDEGAQSDLPRWHHSLPGPLKGHEALKGYTTIGDAAQALVELRGQSERMVEIPAADAPMEEREAFYEKLGRPKGPDGYELRKPENWPADQPWSSKQAKLFAEKAFKVGVPKAMAEQLHSEIVQEGRNALLDQTAQQRAAAEKREETLKQLYGAHVEENVKRAHRSMEMVGGPTVKAELEKQGLLRSPNQIRAWNRIWETIGEERIFAGAADPDGRTQQKRVEGLYPNTEW
jgi:hypothetical protein